MQIPFFGVCICMGVCVFWKAFSISGSRKRKCLAPQSMVSVNVVIVQLENSTYKRITLRIS